MQYPHDQCSKTLTGKIEDDCSVTQCCKVSGYSCYEKKPGTYGCLETCEPARGWTCNMPGFITPLSEVKSHSSLDAKLYCFSAYTKDTGSAKQSFESQGQYERKTRLFAYDFNNVFSDVDVQVGADYPMIKVLCVLLTHWTHWTPSPDPPDPLDPFTRPGPTGPTRLTGPGPTRPTGPIGPTGPNQSERLGVDWWFHSSIL